MECFRVVVVALLLTLSEQSSQENEGCPPHVFCGSYENSGYCGNSNHCYKTKLWYHNAETGKCQQFGYYGEGGNYNRFMSKQHCERTCIGYSKGYKYICNKCPKPEGHIPLTLNFKDLEEMGFFCNGDDCRCPPGKKCCPVIFRVQDDGGVVRRKLESASPIEHSERKVERHREKPVENVKEEISTPLHNEQERVEDKSGTPSMNNKIPEKAESGSDSPVPHEKPDQNPEGDPGTPDEGHPGTPDEGHPGTPDEGHPGTPDEGVEEGESDELETTESQDPTQTAPVRRKRHASNSYQELVGYMCLSPVQGLCDETYDDCEKTRKRHRHGYRKYH